MRFFEFDKDYVDRLAAGDPFVEEHFAGYFRELLTIRLRSRVRSAEILEEAIQETLLRVIRVVRGQGNLDRPACLGGFVHSVCNNVLKEQFRAESRVDAPGDRLPDPPDTRVDLEADLITEQRQRLVRRVLWELPARDRQILEQVCLQELDKDHICARFGVDRGYLRVLLHRARQRFREVLDRSGDAHGLRSSAGGRD